jgi:RNA polymerase sigma-70 factor (ECF subfamily)
LEENREIRVLNRTGAPDETALVARARKGDKSAYGQLVKMYQRRVMRMVVSMTGDVDTAMDIVQDSFIRAYKALDRFEEGQPFYPWLSTIATNLTMNYFKKSRRETGLEAVEHEQAEPAADPLNRMQLEENDRRLMAAVQELPEQYRAVFILRNFEDLSYEEIAARLEISVGTVDSRLYRARRQLLEKLKDLLD